MHKLSPKKLLHSKWTAVSPRHSEKHFMVTRVKLDEAGAVQLCEIEAVMTKKVTAIDWRELQNANEWHPGWR